MAKYEREADERAFDGGEDDDGNESSLLPVVILITILVLAAFSGVVWLAYNQGVAHGRNDAPVRVASTQPAAKADDSGVKVYQQRAGAEEEEVGAKPASQTQTPAQAAAVPAAPVTQAPAPQPAAAVIPPPVQQPAPKPVAQAPVQTPPAAPAPKPAAVKPQVAQAAPQTQPVQPQVATKAPAKLGTATPAPAAPVATAKPAAAKPAPVAAKPAAETPKTAGGAILLQIGAYKSEAEARDAWKVYAAKHATLLNGFSPDVQRTAHDDGSVWFRLRIASFADKDTAVALCERLKAQGGSCFLAK